MAECSRRIQELQFEMIGKVNHLKKACEARGVNILVYCTYRDPIEQARLWRQGRDNATVDKTITTLRKDGLKFLAGLIEEVGPQAGNKVTNAIPGKSWHNFGYAVDCVPIVNDKAVWDTNHPHWEIYGTCATKLGLDWGGNWKSFVDYPHVQFYKQGPFAIYPKGEIERRIKALVAKIK